MNTMLKFRYLAGFGLTGFIPDLSALDALEIMWVILLKFWEYFPFRCSDNFWSQFCWYTIYRDLHNNSFGGDIPDFLGNFPNLREL